MVFKTIGSTALLTTMLAVGFAAAPAMAQKAPGAAPMGEEQCIAEFGKVDEDRNQSLAGPEMSTYESVKADVDADQDGEISQDEYIVACQEGEFEQIYKSQG